MKLQSFTVKEFGINFDSCNKALFDNTLLVKQYEHLNLREYLTSTRFIGGVQPAYSFGRGGISPSAPGMK